jgi:hypothetical protein
VTRWDRDGKSRRHERPSAPGRQHRLLSSVEVVPGVVLVLLDREPGLGIEPGDLDAHARDTAA